LYGDGGFRDLTTDGYSIRALAAQPKMVLDVKLAGPPVYKAQSNPAPPANATSSKGDAISSASSIVSTVPVSASAAKQYTLSRDPPDSQTTGSLYANTAASAASSQTQQKGKTCGLFRRRKKGNK
jgi:hypothetical protein